MTGGIASIASTTTMNTSYSLFNIISTVGIVTVLGAFLYIGRKLHTLDSIQEDIKETIKPDLKGLRSEFNDFKQRLGVVEDRVEALWRDKWAPSNSPRKLNERGENILSESGIKEIVESKKDNLLDLVRSKNTSNVYDADLAIQEVMTELPTLFPDILDELKTGAFKVGADIDAVLFVGSIYLRDLIFADLGFNLTDLDMIKDPTPG